MKRRSIAFILMMSLIPFNFAMAEDNEQLNVNLTDKFDGDLFVQTSTAAPSSYAEGGLYYYDGSRYQSSMVLGDLTYKLDGDMNTRGNDVIKIDTSDVSVSLENSGAVKNFGLVLFSREEQANNEVTVTVAYEGGRTEEHIINVPAMTDEDADVDGTNPLKVVRSGIRWLPTVDDTVLVYLTDTVIANSNSVNKNLSVESVTLGAADFTYYCAAMTVEKFSESELNAQTQQIVRELYAKYSEVNLIQLGSKENGLNFDEANELYSSLLKQEGKMEEATAENIEKIGTLIEGATLYAEIKGYKDSIESLIGSYPEKSSDFTELTETDLTEDDYENLSKLLEAYDSAEKFDDTRLLEIAEQQGVAQGLNIAVDMTNEAKIQSLYDAYTKAAKRAELREKINPIYEIYIEKSIEEITSSDYSTLEELLGYFEEAEIAEVVFEEYDEGYIEHLYNDYEAYQTSESYKAIDVSSRYNVDVFGCAGDMADQSVWYECDENLSGERFVNSPYHANISSYDKENDILYLKEFEFVEDSKYDPNTDITTVKYPFNTTGNIMPFIMPEHGFNTGVVDALLIKSTDTESYTFDMSGRYTDKIYFAISKINSTPINISPVITYADGSKESVSVKVCATGQTVNEIRNKDMTYPDMVGYVTSGDYKNLNMATTGVLYKPESNTTNGISVFAAVTNPEKSPKSITFSAAAGNYLLYGIGEIPALNSVIAERVNTLYAQVVNEDNVDTSDLEAVSQLVLNYNDARSRGLYFENVDAEIMSELSKMVLSASGSIYRENKENVKAEIAFSVPVNEETVEAAITVLSDGTEVDFTHELSDDCMSLTVDVPVTRKGGNVIEVKLAGSIAIKDYPNIGMVNEFAASFTLPYYISASYTNNKLSITNNSNTEQSYIAYVTVEDNGEVVNAETVSGTVSKDSPAQHTVSTELYATETAKIYAAVLDGDTLKPLYEITEPLKTTAVTDMTANYLKPSLNLETDVLTISGVTPSKSEGKVMSVIVNSPQDICLYAGVIETNKDGYFSLDIPISAEKIFVSGYLDIKIGGDDLDPAAVIDDVYFPVMSDRVGIVNNLKTADINTVRSLLIGAEQTLSLNFAPYAECVDSYLSGISSRVMNIQQSLPSISDSDSEQVKKEKISLAQKLIKQQAVLECIKNNRKELVVSGSQLLYADVMDYETIDTNGVTLYSLYKNSTSETGKNAVVTGIMGKNYAVVSELYNDIEKLSMLHALKSPATNGVGHVQKALTKANADAVGVEITKYLNLSNKSQADSYIANMTINSLSDVVSYINTLGSNTGGGSTGGGGGGGGGGSSSSSGASSASMAVVTTTETIPSLADEKSPFTDIGVSHWAYEAVKSLYDKNIISGNGMGEFNPDDTITRAELVKLLCVAKGISPTLNSGRFTDVADSDWYASYVGAVSMAGIVNGVSQTEFGPNQSISRQDLCTILYRADNAEGTGELSFNDTDLIADYAKAAVSYLNAKGIVNGFTDGTFKPQTSCTRAQAAMIIYNYLNA